MPGAEVSCERLPLRVAFRDFVERRRENPNLSLLEYLEVQASTDLSLALPKSFLSKAMDKGQAVLLLDGLDEVGTPEHRVAMCDLVAAFAAAHPDLPILGTSRIAGYDDASLSGKASTVGKNPIRVLFEELVLEQFDDDDLSSFVSHWYGVQESTDPVARDRGIRDLLEALDADERVRELARTPILATLIAMIHRVEANLPGERAKLYELCVRMLLETWPAQAKTPFPEIDPGLQRAYLESLAFDMQMDRGSDKAVTIARGELVAKLMPILQKRDLASEPGEKITGVIERWIDHLERQSGIVVEQSTGVYAFFHLSIMEYLAARGMERERGREAAVAEIVERFAEAAWREVCLLAVGSHAEDGDFLDAVYSGVASSAGDRRWDFLCHCLREEARFRAEQRDTILRQYGGLVLEEGTSSNLTLIEDISRFSIRHRAAVKRWIEERLDYALGDDLLAAVVIASDADLLTRHLAKRPDKPMAAEALLEFWPQSPFGSWAVQEIDPVSTLHWSVTAPSDLALLRSVAAVGEPVEALVAASLLVLNLRTLQLCVEGAEGSTRSMNAGGEFPVQVTQVTSRALIPTLEAGSSQQQNLSVAGSVTAEMAGEAWIALATIGGTASEDSLLGYLLFRIQNRWLFEVWSGIDQRLPENPTSGQLALYFALGWAQSTTTWAWPDSERWLTLFAAGPGEHWLVRSQWHLCKLTDDPNSRDDDEALRAALRDGERDETLPGYLLGFGRFLGWIDGCRFEVLALCASV
jgi:hypothetical protein